MCRQPSGHRTLSSTVGDDGAPKLTFTVELNLVSYCDVDHVQLESSF